MAGLRSAIDDATEDSWRCALIGAILAFPFVAASYLSDSDVLSLTPVVIGGLAAGYLYARGLHAGGRVGFRAGLLGAVPVLGQLVDMLVFITGLPQPALFTLLQAGIAVVVTVLVFGFAGVGGQVGGMVGGWLAAKSGRRRTPAVEG